MWDRAKVLVDRAPYYPAGRPLVGAALGLTVGALYGALCGGLHAALRGAPALLLAWLIPAAGAGLAAGLLMGVCSALGRAARGPAGPPVPRLPRGATWTTAGRAVPPRARVPRRSRRIARRAGLSLARWLGYGRGTPLA